MRLLSLATLATLLASAPSAQTEAPRTTADPRADPSVPVQRAADELRRDPTGIDTRTVSDNQTSDARVTERAADMPMDGSMDMRPGFDRLDRDVRALGNNPDAGRYGQERDAIRRDYDALGANPSMEARMGVMRRYEDLDATVSASRMSTSPRTDYFRMSDDRLGMYDRNIEAVRMGYTAATGNDRSQRAVDLIRLRRQRDMYRNEVYNVRGAGQSGFDSARRTSSQNLSRYDTDFRTARREAMMRDTMAPPAQGAQPMGGTRR